MKPVAIVYYTRTGNTQLVAHELAQRISADLFPIQDARSRRGVLGFLRSLWEVLRQREAQIVAPDVALGRYRVVVVATPVWASNVSSPVSTWLKRSAAALPDVAFVCTYGGSGAESVLKGLANLAGKVPVAQLALRETEIRRATCGEKLDEFGKIIAVAAGMSLPSPMPA
jgi:hypothetical protein